MGFKTTGIQWTNLELTGLLEDEDSCVYLERIRKHLGLHPFHLINLNEALREILNANLNSYDSELNGLLIAYRNPKILSPLGDILYDTCFIHIDIEADFYIFRPEIGRSLKGFVNKKGTNHIGILVHKAFNVSVPKPDDFENQEDWLGYKIKLGQEVKFTPDEIDYKARLPYIRGLIYEEEYLNGCRLFNQQIAATYESEFYKITRWNTAGKDIDNKNISKIQNKRIVFNSDSDVEVNQESESEKKSIKKLKKKFDIQETITSSQKKRKRKSSCRSVSESIDENDKKLNASCKFISESIDQNDEKLNVKIKQNLIFHDLHDSNLEVSKHVSKKQKKSVENNNSFNNEEDEKKQKFLIKKLAQDIFPYNISDAEKEVPNSRVKKYKKVSNNNKANCTEDEQNQKSLIINTTNQSFDNRVTDEKKNEFLFKKSEKWKNKLEYNYTKDEKQYKSNISKSYTQNLTLDDEIQIKSESEILKSQSKKRKRSSIKNNNVNNEDNEKYTLQAKLISGNDESKTKLFKIPSKKRKKKRVGGDVNYDTEDEKKHKKSLIKNLSVVIELHQSNNEGYEVSKKKLEKQKDLIINDDIFMDTEDERKYKSTIKPLIHTIKNNISDNGLEYKDLKQKKHKKKHKLPESELEFDPLFVKIKTEPENENKNML